MRVPPAGEARHVGAHPGGTARRGEGRAGNAGGVALPRRCEARGAHSGGNAGSRRRLLAHGVPTPRGVVPGVPLRGGLSPAVGVDPRSVRRDGVGLNGRRGRGAPMGRCARAGDHRGGPRGDSRGADRAQPRDARGDGPAPRRGRGEATDGRVRSMGAALHRGWLGCVEHRRDARAHGAMVRAGVGDPRGRRRPLRGAAGVVRHGAGADGRVRVGRSVRPIVPAMGSWTAADREGRR